MNETAIGQLYDNFLFEGMSESDVLAKIKELVESGEDVNEASGWSKETPLHSAATYGHTSVINYLLSMGADPTIKDANRSSVLEIVSRNMSNIQSVDSIKDVIKMAAADTDVDTLNEALEKAVHHCNVELIEMFRNYGADLKHTHVDCYTLFTPLAETSEKDFEKLKIVFDYFFMHGIKPWAKDLEAFEWYKHSDETINYLIDNLDTESIYGKTLYEMNNR